MSFTGVTEIKRNLIGRIHLLREIPGFSAYELAVKHGFKGTEAEWLASLKGPKGDIGTLESHSDIDAQGNRVVNVADPEADTDGVNKRYVGEDITEEFFLENDLTEYEYFEASVYKRGKVITVNMCFQLTEKANTSHSDGYASVVNIDINGAYLPKHELYINPANVIVDSASFAAVQDAGIYENEYLAIQWDSKIRPQIMLSFSYFCK